VAAMALASACSARTQGPPPAGARQPARGERPPAPAPQQAQQVAPRQAAAVNPPVSYQAALERIARAIEGLGDRYPQLAGFSAARHLDRERLAISYGHRTHHARHRGGWTSGVPNPDDDGIWFYIDFHDPDSQAQIHTQPVVPELRFREKRVMFLILEGAKSRKVGGALRQVLHENGVHRPR